MPVYTETRTFNATRVGGGKKVLVVKLNGGTCSLEYKIGEDYIVSDAFATDSVVQFSTECDYRVSVSGGATYAIE